MHRALNRILAVSILFTGVNTSVIAAKYAVIGNAKNTASEAVARKQVKRIYLKRMSAWDDGVPGEAYDNPPDSQKHKAFRRAVINMSKARLEDHWLTLKQRSGKTPPRIVHETRKLIRLVGKNQGGFGVLAEDEIEQMTDKVRILFVFDH